MHFCAVIKERACECLKNSRCDKQTSVYCSSPPHAAVDQARVGNCVKPENTHDCLKKSQHVFRESLEFNVFFYKRTSLIVIGLYEKNWCA